MGLCTRGGHSGCAAYQCEHCTTSACLSGLSSTSCRPSPPPERVVCASQVRAAGAPESRVKCSQGFHRKLRTWLALERKAHRCTGWRRVGAHGDVEPALLHCSRQLRVGRFDVQTLCLLRRRGHHQNTQRQRNGPRAREWRRVHHEEGGREREGLVSGYARPEFAPSRYRPRALVACSRACARRTNRRPRRPPETPACG